MRPVLLGAALGFLATVLVGLLTAGALRPGESAYVLGKAAGTLAPIAAGVGALGGYLFRIGRRGWSALFAAAVAVLALCPPALVLLARAMSSHAGPSEPLTVTHTAGGNVLTHPTLGFTVTLPLELEHDADVARQLSESAGDRTRIEAFRSRDGSLAVIRVGAPLLIRDLEEFVRGMESDVRVSMPAVTLERSGEGAHTELRAEGMLRAQPVLARTMFVRAPDMDESMIPISLQLVGIEPDAARAIAATFAPR